MRRTACGVCKATKLVPILDLGTSPLADAFPKTPNAEEARYPLDLLLCPFCGLVQLGEIVPDHLLYGEDYGFFSGSSPALVDYFADYAAEMFSRFPLEIARGVIEIASNDGTLLRHFKDAVQNQGCFWGIDPAAPAAAAAQERGIRTACKRFEYDLVKDWIVRPGLIIANNVLAHVADPVDLLRGVAHLLSGTGVAVFEFQYLPHLLFGNQIDHVYHEHRSFFSLRPLMDAALRVGLHVFDCHPTPMQGGSLRVYVDHGFRSPTSRVHETISRENRQHLDDPVTYGGWQVRAEYLRSELRSIVRRLREDRKQIAGYGASAKSTTLLNWCGFGPSDICRVEDTTPHKIGRYTPGTHIPIMPPGTTADAYLVTVWNYLPSILRREREFIERGGRFIVPIPSPVLL